MQLKNYEHSDPNVAEASQQAKRGKLKRPSKAMLRKSNVQSSNLDSFVTRNQNLPRSSPNADDDRDQAAYESDTNLDPNLLPPTQQRKTRHVDAIPPPNASKPTFKIPKRTREAFASSQAPQEAETSTHAQPLNLGQFSKSDSDLIRAWRETYCAEHQWSHQKFDDTIQANARNDNTLQRFWTEICEQIPHRSRQAIQKHCRREFHHYQKRGIWTPEDDETLKRAVAEKGRSWKAIGEAMGRLHEDVRDRWRNYLYQGENRNTEAWTDDEVKALVKAVGECIWLMHNELQEERDLELQRTGVARDRAADLESEDMLEKLINWQVVSDRMQGQRSRLQCSYKWARLKQAGRIDSQKAARKADRDLRRYEEGHMEPNNPVVKDWRVRKARKKVTKQMTNGDKLDFLQALSRQRVKEEMHIVWSAVGRGEPWRKKWETMDLKIAWIIMKKEIGEEGPLGDRYVTVANTLIEKLLMEEPKEPESGEYRWFMQELASVEGADRQETELGDLLAPVHQDVRGGGPLHEQEGDGEQRGGYVNDAKDQALEEYYRSLDVWIMGQLEQMTTGELQAAYRAHQVEKQGLPLEKQGLELDDIAAGFLF